MKKENKARNFTIFKANGRPEKFSRKKLFISLRRSGLPKKDCDKIVSTVSRQVNEGTSTIDIYRKTRRLVDQTSHVAAIHYSLKRAIFDLGPSGYNFELLVAKYFEELGYETEVCKTLKGRWVKHEVDVIATKGHERVFVECKFHNRSGIKNDIKVALYVKSRWDDLKEGPEGANLNSFFLASNTSFTIDAITYAQGTGINLLGVNAPAENSFLDQIKLLNLYPLTSLKRLSKYLKLELLSRGIVLAKELPDHRRLLFNLGMDNHEIDVLILEVDQLLKGK
jgi:hypothetical protein